MSDALIVDSVLEFFKGEAFPYVCFWARVIADTHLTSSGWQASIIPASSIVSILVYK